MGRPVGDYYPVVAIAIFLAVALMFIAMFSGWF